MVGAVRARGLVNQQRNDTMKEVFHGSSGVTPDSLKAESE